MTTYYSPKQKAIAIAPKFTSAASVLGSGFIIFEIVRDRKKLQTTFHRILLGMCLCDLLSSAWFFMGTWPIPAGTAGVYGASGTQASCIAQGFFSQLSLTTAMYNACLSVFYLLQIRNGWHSDRIRKKAEPWLHASALAIGLGTSFAGVFLNLYNNDYWECWIAPLPTDCKESWKYGSEGNCVRGDNASLYRWVFYYAPLWAAIVAVTICMFIVYRSVLEHEKAVEQYGSHDRKFSKKVAIQGYWYCGAFYMTWILPTITRLTQVIIGDKTPFWLICLTAMFVPIQGALNFCVYIRPRYKKYRATRALAHWSHSIHCCTIHCCTIGCPLPKRTPRGEGRPYSDSRFSTLFFSSKHQKGDTHSPHVSSFFNSRRESNHSESKCESNEGFKSSDVRAKDDNRIPKSVSSKDDQKAECTEIWKENSSESPDNACREMWAANRSESSDRDSEADKGARRGSAE